MALSSYQSIYRKLQCYPLRLHASLVRDFAHHPALDLASCKLAIFAVVPLFSPKLKICTFSPITSMDGLLLRLNESVPRYRMPPRGIPRPSAGWLQEMRTRFFGFGQCHCLFLLSCWTPDQCCQVVCSCFLCWNHPTPKYCCEWPCSPDCDSDKVLGTAVS